MRNYYKTLIRWAFLSISVLFSVDAGAQFYNGSQLTFGKNRVQHKVDRFWTHYRYASFDTYFYMGGREYALHTARYAMEIMPELEKRLDYTLSEKIQFVVFNNLSELKESNIGLLSDESYNIGGITYIVGTKVFLYFEGSYIHLEKQIRQGLAQVMVNEMLYGSEISTQVKNSTLINFPEWYLNGLVSYIADDWDITTDNFVRDGILSGRYSKFNSLTGTDAVYAGHSIWKYVADKYGKSAIPNILYMTKVSRQINNGFLFVIGIPFTTFSEEWMEYFRDNYYLFDNDREQPEGELIRIKQKKDMVISQLKISPDEQHIAYVTNESGKYKILLYNAETGKTKKLLRRGHRLDEKVDYSYPLLAWHPSGKLFTFMIEEEGYTWIYSYTLEEDLLERDMLKDFQKITSYSFSPNGELLVLSAIQRGQSDLFVYSRSSRTSENITRDVYDDYHPRFTDQGRRIIFSSNRPDATIAFDPITARLDTHKISDRQEYRDLFVYDYQTKSNQLRRVTNTPYYDEIQPMESERGFITYLSDENGIFNRHLARFDSTVAYIDTITHYHYFYVSAPVTNYRRDIQEQDVSSSGGTLSQIVYEGGQYQMYRTTIPGAEDLAQGISMTNTTYRMQQHARQRATLHSEKEEPADTLAEKQKPEPKRRFVTVKITQDSPSDSSRIDLNDYELSGSDKRLSTRKSEKSFYIPKERVYAVAFSINQLVSQVDLGYINSAYQSYTGGGQPIYINPGVNSYFRLGLTDLLEDYRITGGVRISFNLQNNEYFLSFENLKNRWDRQVILHRKTLETYNYYSIIRTHAHEVHYNLKYIFSNVFAIKNSIIGRLDNDIYMGTDLNNLERKDILKAWITLRSELIFDNTRDRGMNTLFGTRWKAFGEYYQKADMLNQRMLVLGGDFRQYTQISKTFIWANRIAASTSLGNNKLIYYMGGVDNWLLPKFNNTINIDESQNWVYQTLATNMRGFHQNIRNGNSFVVLNSELRMPVFRYFFDRPLRNNFLNHFQVIAFGDLGTAWTGPNPWSEENALYTQIIEQGPIRLTVKRQVEPFVTGFGFGVRSSILGYFIRADWSWGVEDSTLNKSVFYISLGLDF